MNAVAIIYLFEGQFSTWRAPPAITAQHVVSRSSSGSRAGQNGWLAFHLEQQQTRFEVFLLRECSSLTVLCDPRLDSAVRWLWLLITGHV